MVSYFSFDHQFETLIPTGEKWEWCRCTSSTRGCYNRYTDGSSEHRGTGAGIFFTPRSHRAGRALPLMCRRVTYSGRRPIADYHQQMSVLRTMLFSNIRHFVMCRYLLHLQIAQHVAIFLNVLSLAAIVMFGNIFSCRIVDVWNSISDAVVKSRYVASLKKSVYCWSK